MFKVLISAGLACLISANAIAENLPPSARSRGEAPVQTKGTATDTLTDAAIVAMIIAASIAAYKAMGKPCACPSDRMRNGRRCGGNSAYARAGGFRPLCFPTDVTPDMIKAYRAAKVVPSLR